MKSLRTMIALALLLPIGAWAGSLATMPGTDASVLPEVASAPPLKTTTSDRCCWVYMYGNWWCFPC